MICPNCGSEAIEASGNIVCPLCEPKEVDILFSPAGDEPTLPADPLAAQHGGSHYKSLAIQPVEYCQRNGIQFCEASAIKYLTRHRVKGGEEDLRKAMHFCQLALQFGYGVKSEVVYH